MWRARPRPARAKLESPPDADLQAPLEQLMRALDEALALGALETAERLVRDVLGRNETPEFTAPELARPMVEALLMLGERGRAQAIATRYRSALAATATGQGLLELSGLDSDDWLPDGRPNALRLSRRIAAGKLDAEGIARLLSSKPWAFASAPDLHLLCFSALYPADAARAVRWLNRYLHAYGAPTCDLSATGDGNVLTQLRFEPPGTAKATGKQVSVLLAARNAAGTVEYALRSLLTQSYPHLEILVGDDASDDATLDVLRRLCRDQPRVRVFRSSRRQGAYNLRNALAAHASGTYLTFHDADDLALPHRIARQVLQLERPQSVGCVANFVRLRPDGNVLFFKDQRATRLCPVSLMLRREAFTAVGRFRSARVGADLELYTALRARYGDEALIRLREPLLLGLAAPESATRSAGTEALEDGYRSPARRAYSQALCERYLTEGRLTNEDLEVRLRETGNYFDPGELFEVDVGRTQIGA